MKKKILTILISILALCTCMFTLTACGGKVEFKINFVVDNQVYATVTTSGSEIIRMPENPTKEDYNFDGWFWDKDVWEKPFTANSLLDAPLSSDMSVYAKFTKKHVHDYKAVVTDPTCTEKGFTTYTCECNDSYVDDYVDELGHSFTDYKYNNDAKCGIDGTETALCDNGCGESDKRTKTGSALEHAFSTPKYTWEDNQCTATRVCSRDNTHIETETVTAIYVKDTDATCLVAEKGHYKATFNNNAFEIQETEEVSVVNGEPLNHSFNNPFYVWNDNQCTATRVCAHDDTHVETETVTGTYVKDTDATCTTAEKGHYEAAFTNSAFTAQATATNSVENGKELGHSFTNYEYNDDAKCGIDGTETAVCDHNCGESDTKTKAGSALQHDYAQTQYAWNGNQCIAIRVCNRDNTHIETETATGIYVKDTDATCTTAEKGHYEATFVNSSFATQSTIPNSVINGEALGHSYASKWEKDAIHHWHKADCEHTNEISEKIEHDFGTDNICDTCEYVRGIAVSGITLNYTSFAMMVGETKTLIATITPENATNKNVMWTTSNSSVATIDENGVVTAIGAGNAIVYAVTEDSAKMAQCIVVVIANECEHTTTRTERENEVDSTCKEVGSYDEVVYCSVCGNELSRIQKIIAKKETHTPVTDARVEPTFTETGLTEGSHCSVCGFVIVEQEIIPVKPSKAEISSEQLTVNGTNISGKFSYATTEFNFANDISVTNSDTWVLSSDANGEYTIITKKATLTEGDNILYIHVENPDKTVTTYTVNIYRNHMYTVSFDADGGTSVETQFVEEGYLATEPTTTRTGYTFNSWDYDFATPIIANTTITATWSANTNTKYVVEYYLQNLKNDDYTIDNTRSYQTVGTTDNTATITPENIEHFTLNQDLSVLSGNIDGKGDLVLKVYYTRNSYTITTNRNNTKAGTVTSGGTYKYDKQITVTATTNDGYIFLGWYNGETKVYNELSYTFNVCETITLTAKWQTNIYNVEYELNGGENNKDDVATYTIETATFALKTPTKTGYNFNGWFTEETFKNQVTEITLGSFGDVKVYAKWTPTNYTVTYNYGYAEKVTTDTYNIETPTFDLIMPTRDGYKFDGWYLEGTFKNQVTKVEIGSYGDKVYYAKWSANTDTKYVIEYYLQNIDNANYTLDNTRSYETVGTTDTTATVTPETIEHFTFNSSMSELSGNIDGKGGLVLKVYYTRDTYTVTTNVINTKAGVVTNGGIYKFDKQITLTATTNAGYTFLGWFNGETIVFEAEIYTFKVNETIALTAKWSANTDTKYVVNYYLQNLDNNEYTLYECDELEGETDTTANAEIKVYTHFTFNNAYNMNVLSGNIDGDGNRVLSVYYTRNTYTLLVNNSSIGSITNAGTYKYGKAITTTAMPYLGYDFLGWYSGEELLSTDIEYTFILEKDITTKFEVKEEMSNFNFTSTASTCSITGIIDESVPKIIVPDYVTSIGKSTFKNCSNLTEITLPFVGATKNGTSNTYFGYIFGASSYSYNVDYVPTLLKKVTIIGGNISSYAFNECSRLTSVVIGNDVTSIGKSAFYKCSNLAEITLPFVGATKEGTSNTHFGYIFGASSLSSNDSYVPSSLKKATITGGEIFEYAFINCNNLTNVVIPDSAISIGNYAFSNCTSLTSVVIPDSVISIGDYAFSDCHKLTSVLIGDGVISISNYAFSFCGNLTNIKVSDANNKYKDVDGNLYSKDGTTFIQYAIGKTETEFVVPNGVIIIGDYAFRYSINLTSVVISNGVTSIGEDAFLYCSSLTSIVIPDSIRSIGDAFYGCDSLMNVYISNIEAWCNISGLSSLMADSSDNKNLYLNNEPITELVIPDGVLSISDSAFEGCSGLTSITIPDSVISIGSSAFEGCSGLTSITIPDSVISIGSSAFSNCSRLSSVYISDIEAWCNIEFQVNFTANPLYYAKNLYLNNELVTELIIPDGVTLIGESVFYNCTSLTSVEIPDSVSLIGDCAFYNCSNLMSIVIPDTVLSIGGRAFYNCSSLTFNIYGNCRYLGNENNPYFALIDTISTNYSSYNIHQSTKVIASLAFYNCKSLTSIIIPDGVTSIGKSVFHNCTSLTSVEIPDSITSIGVNAFYNCSSLTCITIPDSVTSIGDSAFEDCSSLISITIPNGVKSIANFAFEDCTSLTSVEIPDSVTSIGFNAFYNCSSLTGITIPDSVTSIDASAFEGCSSLTSVVIPDNVTSIGTYAFRECSSLTSVIIGEGATSIGGWAFYNCSSLMQIIVSDNNTAYQSIDGNLYDKSGCTLIQYAIGKTATDFVIPDGVTSIEAGAFRGCSSLTSVIIPASVTSIDSWAFAYCTNLTSITIPDGVTSINYNAFTNCTNLTSITIPNSVTLIDAYAFRQCSSLTRIKYRGTSLQWSAIEKGYGWNEKAGSCTVTYNYTGI